MVQIENWRGLMVSEEKLVRTWGNHSNVSISQPLYIYIYIYIYI